MSKYFKPEETKCKCGCGRDVQPQLLEALDKAREIADTPFVITSGMRCNYHNTNIGASRTSSHTQGLAVDISYKDKHTMAKIIYGATLAGFKRIGVHDKFIHLDIDNNKPNAIWKY